MYHVGTRKKQIWYIVEISIECTLLATKDNSMRCKTDYLKSISV
jgi:hypothetical protein